MKTIATDKAPAALGPYSQAKVVNGFMFASGQCPIDPATGEVENSSIEAAAELACKNCEALAEAAGTDLTKVIKTTCFLKDMGDFAAFNEVYAKYFTEAPARSCIAAKQLPKDMLCEIEFIAEV